MKHTLRINRINDLLNRIFPDNNDSWWVNNEFCRHPSIICLHRGYGGDGVNPKDVAEAIFSHEKSVHTIICNYNLTTYYR